MAYTISLSDGTTTIDLYDGTDSRVREGGLNMPPPMVDASFISNPLYDGDRLARSRYGNREITLTIKIEGSSLSDLQTNIRSINRLLNDAEERTLLGYGSQVYLEYQWGEVGGASVYFDVLRGDLAMPHDYLSRVLSKHFDVINAQLRLTCKPFGRYTNQTIAQDTIQNSQSIYEPEIYYIAGDDTTQSFYGIFWLAQTFTTVGAFDIKAVAVKIYKFGTPGDDLTVSIYDTTAGEPSGNLLVSADISVADVAGSGTYIGYNMAIFSSPYSLSATHQYAIVLSSPSASAGKHYNWRYDNGDASFANGTRLDSSDSGGTWTNSATDDHLFVVYSAETDTNYQDITTTAAYGDVPAPFYLELGQASASGSKKIWVAKRSGARQTDDLWFEGEDYSSITETATSEANETLVATFGVETDASAGMFAEKVIVAGATHHAANQDIGYWSYTISTVPKGQFRVLTRCRVITQDANDFDHISFGVGWSYGDKTYAPTEANSEFYQCAANNTWEILDLGDIILPPIAESDIAGNNTLSLRIHHYITELLYTTEYYKWDMDYIFLIPIDEGLVIVDSIAAADVLGIDSISDPPNVFITEATPTIEDYPTKTGRPFTIGRESTRIYFLRDDDKLMTFTSDITYQPKFLII